MLKVKKLLVELVLNDAKFATLQQEELNGPAKEWRNRVKWSFFK